MQARALSGAVAQLGERRPCKAEAVGSIPICSTILVGPRDISQEGSRGFTKPCCSSLTT
jgi:hypothetical protein